MFKIPVNYTTSVNGEATPFAETLDAGATEDKEVKLSHHRSGFVQFSGPGVLSGIDESGRPKGFAIHSFSLEKPVPGPSFCVTFLGLEEYRRATSTPRDSVVFREDDCAQIHDANAVVVEGFYFPPPFRRFVTLVGDEPILLSAHPSGVVMRLKVVLAPEDSSWPGLIGLHLYRIATSFGEDKSGFIISGPTTNVRVNDRGEKIAEGIYCACPGSLKLGRLRDLNFIASRPQL